ncbi:helix-turn-helix domain-containing protein [Thalassobius sp. Cn5-15]|uniref:helix-turn-helix domain-containing protein n=1 Tax=Thalassobius sp. Cn5-15 TaxID=2917763 RepID=UPI001EF2C5EC|nr:helix-turn-helix transcriptional regulator [Thalassobius sp. Cn5-15]MCG7492427.1 helix-turn-helix domain-containing protein [Thalassobius sp. Cn5-15]
MISTRKTIGANIQRLRRERGLTVCCLAERTGKNPNSLNRIERGQTRLSVDVLACICRHLNVTPNDLYGWEPTQ